MFKAGDDIANHCRLKIMTRFFKLFLAVLALLCAIVPFRHSDKIERAVISPDRERGRSGALEALDFWTRARAYPDADIPPDKYYKAYADSKNKMKASSFVSQSASVWETIGPTNLTGRTISVAINPLNGNTIYVGAASGGLWRSYTGGLG